MELLKAHSDEFEDKIEQFHDSIFLNIGSSIKKIPLDSILFIKGYGDYMQVKCSDSIYTVNIRMKKLDELLPTNEFFRIHKSYIVRLDKINHIYKKSLEIDNTSIPISRNSKEALLKKIPWIK